MRIGPQATAVSALVELGTGIAAGVLGFERYRLALYRAALELGFAEKASVAAAYDPDGNQLGVLQGFGAAAALSFVLTPIGALAAFLFLEGLVRLTHVLVTGEGCGFLVTAAWEWFQRRRAARPDRIHRFADGTLTVEGAPRSWDRLSTFELDGLFYVLADRAEIPDGVRFTLRPMPDDHLMRGVIHLGATPEARGARRRVSSTGDRPPGA
jgi:hypothetical protein